MKLALDKIRLDGGTQPRAELREEVIAEYAELMAEGVKFPPVIVFFDGDQYWLADGFHRVKAALRQAPNQPIDAKVCQGVLADAQWYSYGVNKTHGLRRTNKDKARAVEAALSHPNCRDLSDAAVAEHVGVCRDTVMLKRQNLSAMQSAKVGGTLALADLPESGKSAARKGRDGRTINTAHIGKSRKTKKFQAGKISPKALMPIRGHDEPCPMIPVQFSPRSPKSAAATLWELFSRDFIEQLVEQLTTRLTSGECP